MKLSLLLLFIIIIIIIVLYYWFFMATVVWLPEKIEAPLSYSFKTKNENICEGEGKQMVPPILKEDPIKRTERSVLMGPGRPSLSVDTTRPAEREGMGQYDIKGHQTLSSFLPFLVMKT